MADRDERFEMTASQRAYVESLRTERARFKALAREAVMSLLVDMGIGVREGDPR